jgi:hypothetical protein
VVEVEEYVVLEDVTPPVIRLNAGDDGVRFTTPEGRNIVIHTFELVRRAHVLDGPSCAHITAELTAAPQKTMVRRGRPSPAI